jgi:transcription initiation factor TFIIIB Brf1 subunit/transcription initiation factor TFIIB
MEDFEDFFETQHEPVNDCDHEVSFLENGVAICNKCYCEVNNLDHESEWKCYKGFSAVRCHTKGPVKGSIKTIFSDLKIPNSVVNEAIISKTEEKYKNIVGDSTVRGDKRKGIVAACLYHVFHDQGDFRTIKDLEILFSLNKEKISAGMKAYHAKFPESRTQNIKPVSLIEKTMKQVGISADKYSHIVEIANNIENRDSVINRSSPQSVAPSIVYYYLCLCPEYKKLIDMTKSKFASRVDLSEITITKIVKKINEIYTNKFGISNVDIS